MARPFEFKPEYCDIAEKVLASGESIAAVAAELNTTKPTIYSWKDEFPEFKLALEKGLAKAQRDWEQIGKMGATGCFEKFSAPAWIFTMKNRFRDDYRDEAKEEKTTEVSVLEKILNGEITVNK